MSAYFSTINERIGVYRWIFDYFTFVCPCVIGSVLERAVHLDRYVRVRDIGLLNFGESKQGKSLRQLAGSMCVAITLGE